MIAQVYVDVGVAQLDRPFDYAVPVEWQERIKVGTRVKVSFNGRMLAGFVVGLVDSSDQTKLIPLTQLVSEEVVLPPASIELIRAVADHCAGSFMDVARLAVPPRLARSEKSVHPLVESRPVDLSACPVDLYPLGTGLRQALQAGKTPRAAWTLAPVPGPAGSWAEGLAGLAASTVASGRSVLVVVPDAKDCGRVLAAVNSVIDPRTVVSLSADKGPGARYSAFLAASRGQARVVVGTRAAVYTPLADLGVILVWEEADSSFSEPHFPYPSLRDIVAIRAGQSPCAVVFASYSRSTAIQNWVDKGWLHEIVSPGGASAFGAAQVRCASQDDRALDRDPAAHTSRLPHDVFRVIRSGLTLGPVLVWVPWVGHRRNFLCAGCGEPIRCACGGGFEEKTSGVICCQLCGRSADGWQCSCGSKRWRAVTLGSARTAEELAGAFRAVPVIRSDSQNRVDHLGGEPVIVIATPGCEPWAEGGFAAAVILDATGFLARPDIRVGEEALRRWLSVVPLVRPGQEGGTALIVGTGNDRVIQAWLRLDPVGFARRELDERRESGFPPATRMASFSGDLAGVEEAAAILRQAGFVELLGPVQEIDSEDYRLIARVPAARGEDLARLLALSAVRRSQSKKAGKLTSRLDPDWLGG